MISNIHKFREKLDAGRFCLGAGITFSDPAVVEALSDSVDFLWIDLEHNPTNLESLLAHLIAARAGGAPALVRVPSQEIAWIKRVLDTGAEGIILPQADSAAEIREFVSACRYPPKGTRGFGPRRPTNYARFGGDEYLEHANRNLFVVAQIETVSALNELDEIVAIDGLDSLVVGPYDLSGSMGILGQVHHQQVLDAVRTVAEKAKAAGLYIGMGMGADAEHALEAAQLGVQWAQCGNDFEFMIHRTDQLYHDVRERLSQT
ncbi:MAG: 4-hydroxy-3-methylbut-2-en-1-yl diphosphate synthase [Planctomycetaceae bacterium]|jgi:2-keto-3-deoxy-L-rhamnonate aldolase RhmA|nr:4-hydroxy-3-methylbut-2-en-1-yl diphosphate synthase [Planctomycetaceae bacterium]MBT6498052.1 4-hydroxy-3-methylbut-2-en-1-yl diphosphate synthase [Planctomycetaceae bacterium]